VNIVTASTDVPRDLAKVRELIDRMKVGMLTTFDREFGPRRADSTRSPGTST
jgi:hypothetical protein